MVRTKMTEPDKSEYFTGGITVTSETAFLPKLIRSMLARQLSAVFGAYTVHVVTCVVLCALDSAPFPIS